MKIFLTICLIFSLNSCYLVGKGNRIKFEIENKSGFPIENIKFTTSENLSLINFDEIAVNEKVSGVLSMKDNKIDGEYILTFTRVNGNTETDGYGYYTNGSPLNDSVEFKILKETVTHKFKKIKY